MPPQDGDLPAGSGVPEPNRPVFACRGEQTAVGVEGQAVDGRRKVMTALPVARSQPFTARSCVAAPRRARSGLRATPVTPWFAGLRVRSSSRLSTSHSFTVRSRLADARQRPSGLQATEVTGRV